MSMDWDAIRDKAVERQKKIDKLGEEIKSNQGSEGKNTIFTSENDAELFKDEAEYRGIKEYLEREIDPDDKNEVRLKIHDAMVLQGHYERMLIEQYSARPNTLWDVGDEEQRRGRARVQTEVRRWSRLPRVRTDKDVLDRSNMFLDECAILGETPTLEKYALALGLSMQGLRNQRQGVVKVSPERQRILNETVLTIHAFESQMVMEGLLDKEVYKFRAKNYYGMEDKIIQQVVEYDPLGDAISVKELERKYDNLVIDAEYEEED